MIIWLCKISKNCNYTANFELNLHEYDIKLKMAGIVVDEDLE